jgi:hypothetical protein
VAFLIFVLFVIFVAFLIFVLFVIFVAFPSSCPSWLVVQGRRTLSVASSTISSTCIGPP